MGSNRRRHEVARRQGYGRGICRHRRLPRHELPGGGGTEAEHEPRDLGEKPQSVLSLLRKEAAAVIAYRDKVGGFKTIDDLKSVPGVDFKKIEAGKDRILLLSQPAAVACRQLTVTSPASTSRSAQSMEYRQLGRTDMRVAAISFGAWAIGGSWGQVDDDASMKALHAAVDCRGQLHRHRGRLRPRPQRRLIARLRRERPRDTIYVATKAGRRLPAQTVEGYTRQNLAGWVERSLENLDTEAVDLLQLHCPPFELIRREEVFGFLDDLVRAGRCGSGVSVETAEEALAAMRHPHVQTVQIIFNMFRHKPAERVLPEAGKRSVGILARVPLASGLLTGKLRADTAFAADDHRLFNREGQAFDKGETLSGVPYATGSRRSSGCVRWCPPVRRSPSSPCGDPDVRPGGLRDSGGEERGQARGTSPRQRCPRCRRRRCEPWPRCKMHSCASTCMPPGRSGVPRWPLLRRREM